MKNVIVLGSTGTLGVAALKVLKKYEKCFRVFGLVAGINGELLQQQVCSFGPSEVPRALLSSRDGQKKILELINSPEVDIVMNLIPGLAGLPASEAALKSGKTLLLANKESLVAAGENLMKIANEKNVEPAPGGQNEYSSCSRIIPLDSEHNAIFEILQSLPAHSFSDATSALVSNEPGLHSSFPKVGNSESRNANHPPTHNMLAQIEAIYLPCSGGPFLGYSKSQLKNVTVKDVLNHPVWKMGPKVTVESATLLNKGFEIIEAHHLFDLPLSKIKVFIHPEGQIHGIVKFKKPKNEASAPTALSYSSRPSMAIHIENALRHAAGLPQIKGRIYPLSSEELKAITSKKPDHKTFPGIKLVLAAFAAGPMTPFLRHEEKGIAHFLSGRIHFTQLLRQLSFQ